MPRTDDAAPPLDIEHVHVEDDPRLWAARTKSICVFTLMLGALSPTLGANIFYPALASLEQQLRATTATISLSVSLYILFQGTVPLLWSSVSELIGRKRIFIAGSLIFAVCSLVCGLANSMALLIAMRCISAIGSSPMLSIGAGTLADMYEPHERGAKVGLYYSAPLLAPALSPIIGGALTEADSWRATFYFLAAAGVAMFLSFTLLFKETFRPERSLAWTHARQRALRRADAQRKDDELHPAKAARRRAEQHRREQHPPFLTRLVRHIAHAGDHLRSALDPLLRRGASSAAEDEKPGAATAPAPSRRSSAGTAVEPPSAPAAQLIPHRELPSAPFEPPRFLQPTASPRTPSIPNTSEGYGTPAVRVQEHTSTRAAEAAGGAGVDGKGGLVTTTASRPQRALSRGISRTESRRSALSRTRSNKVVTATGEEITFKPTFADVNPIRPIIAVLSEPHNIVALFTSGLNFGSFYCLMLTLTRTLAGPLDPAAASASSDANPGTRSGAGYGYSPILVGVVLLSIGGGGMLGSIVGGRLSDARIRRIRAGTVVSPLVSPSSVAARARVGNLEVGPSEGEAPPAIVVEPEERILSAIVPMIFVPITYIAYAWASYYRVHIAALCVILFLLGTSQFAAYACFLSFVVDSNKGKGSSAVACNSAFRGTVAFVASEIASDLVDAMGNGWLYTGWAFALGITEIALFFVAFQARRWRSEGFKWNQQDWRFLRLRNWRA